MAKSLTVAEVLSCLERGDFAEIVGSAEDEQLEFKGAPYHLANDAMKLELAKDVTALANAEGGIILLGFRTCKDPDSSIEFVDECRPFDRGLVDVDQYAKVLAEWVCPMMGSVRILPFESPTHPGKIVVAVHVPPSETENKPFLVNRSVDADGKVKGTQFGYYERVRDRIPTTSAEALRGYIRDGMRFSEILRKLDSIQTFLGNSEPTPTPGVAESDVISRISEAEFAVDRAERPNIVLSAVSTSLSSFPELFSSHSAEVVGLIEEPPVMRKDGFAITPSGARWSSQIIQGRLRRVVARGNRLIELWQDGALIAVGPGDDDMLCWFTRSHTNHKPGLPIRSFVLAEVTLNFCNLAAEVFRHAVPAPSHVRFVLRLDNMTEDGVPCTLGIGDDRGANIFRTPGSILSAPGPILESSYTAPFSDLDIGHVVYQLLGGVYVKFGFSYEQMPYLDTAQKRITRETLFPQMQT
jgi:hypothetical protein